MQPQPRESKTGHVFMLTFLSSSRAGMHFLLRTWEPFEPQPLLVSQAMC